MHKKNIATADPNIATQTHGSGKHELHFYLSYS